MKHHIEIVYFVPRCELGSCCGTGGKIVDERLIPLCTNDDHDYYEAQNKCDAFDAQAERDGVKLIGASCKWFSCMERRVAFDCISYEFDAVNGFRSKGREYGADSITQVKIDGATVFQANLRLEVNDDGH